MKEMCIFNRLVGDISLVHVTIYVESLRMGFGCLENKFTILIRTNALMVYDIIFNHVDPCHN